MKNNEFSSKVFRRIFQYYKIRLRPIVPIIFLTLALSALILTSCDSGVASGANGDMPFIPGVYDYTFYVDNANQMQAAVDAVNQIGNNKSFNLVIGGNFSIPGYTNNTFKNTGISVTISSDYGRSISLNYNSTGRLLVIGPNQTVILQDVSLVGQGGNNISLVHVNGGTFSMSSNASVSGNTNNSGSGGGGVYVSSGTFTMSDNASVSGNSATYGGGVYVSSGTFNMSDNASLSGNSASYGGGGVYVESGSFSMQDSAGISSNTANSNGGGVYLSGGSFSMRDSASVSGNTTGSIYLAYGGGVYVGSGAFTMNGNASVYGNSASYGGGVYVDGGNFIMGGGTVNGSVGSYANNASYGASLYSDGTATYGDGSNILTSGYYTDDTITGYGGIAWPPDATALTAGQWMNGNIYSGEAWYSFYANAGTRYYVWWNDSFEGNGSKTADVKVTAYDNYDDEVFSTDSGWLNAKTINLSSSGTVYLKVTPDWGGGSFAIVYSTSNSRPGTSGSAAPSAPTDVYISDYSSNSITVSWDPVSNANGYYVYRARSSSGPYSNIGSQYSYYSFFTDAGVSPNTTYYYKVSAYNSNGEGPLSDYTGTTTDPAWSPGSYTTLTEGAWASGNILSPGGEQWFCFVATSSEQYIHFETGTLQYAYVQLYDTNQNTVGSTYYSSSSFSRQQPLTSGRTYYIQIYNNYSGYSGTYKIAFSSSSDSPGGAVAAYYWINENDEVSLSDGSGGWKPPAPVNWLPVNTWVNGNIPSSGGEQWFCFIANSSAQYIHYKTISLSYATVQLYDSGGNYYNTINFSTGGSIYSSVSVTSGQKYYIKVSPYNLYYTGTFQIGFSASYTSPSASWSGSTENLIVINTGQTLNISPDGGGYSGHRWFVNGVEDTSQTGVGYYTFSGADKEPGRAYTITLTVQKSGKYYNANFTVIIQQ